LHEYKQTKNFFDKKQKWHNLTILREFSTCRKKVFFQKHRNFFQKAKIFGREK
jgi:hypothetical protein